MSIIYRSISKDASVVASAIDATDIVAEIERIHKPSAVVTAALGRLSVAASLIGNGLKGEQDSVTLRIKGGGPAGTLIAVADSRGNVKSYVSNPIVEIPLNQYGKLDVAGAVGRDGTLSVIKDLGMKEPETWEDWLAYWRAVRDNDLNGNGDPSDEIPVAFAGGTDGERSLTMLMNAFGIAASNDTQFCVLEDGTYTMVYEHPRYPEYLEAVTGLYAEGILRVEEGGSE